ncbi:hypothetical protein JW756_01040 [Candidatus Woesearchaeota archaeon]|nr:hypothetical protein [Candidatus Woesearchaeota archaeon]
MIDYKPFCKNQMATQENPEGTDCVIHCQEGDVFRCRYKPEDIGYDSRRGFYIKWQNPDPKGPSGSCPDFSACGLKDEITEQIKNVPDDKKLEALVQILYKK